MAALGHSVTCFNRGGHHVSGKEFDNGKVKRYTICNVAQRGISLLSTPIFTRILTTEQYGVYSIYQSWYQILFIFATLNLTYGVYNNGLTKYEDDRLTFTASMQGLSTTITAGLFLIYIVAQPFWEKIFGL